MFQDLRRAFRWTSCALAVLGFVFAFESMSFGQVALRADKVYLRQLLASGNWATFCNGPHSYYRFGGAALPNAQRLTWQCGTITHSDLTRVGDGECVDFVKKLAKSQVASIAWIKGPSVVGRDGTVLKTLSPGAILATFNAKGKYEGHTVVFLSRMNDTTIAVADQNYIPNINTAKCVGGHTLSLTFNGNVADLARYHMVQTP